MALKLLQPGQQPLGQFDGIDAQITGLLSLKGGEVVTFTSVVVPGTDKAAADAFDGYVNPGGIQKRPAVTRNLAQGKRPLMLADDGIAGYGTIFGSVVGGFVGQITAGAVLGPHTATGSGKITCWEKPGLYAVSLDACDQDPATGLQPTNTGLDVGAPLYATSLGLLTPDGTASFEAGVVVGRFVDFETNGSLVTTPNRLVQALTGPRQFAYATFYFNPPAL
jgi:hypothetical protein